MVLFKNTLSSQCKKSITVVKIKTLKGNLQHNTQYYVQYLYSLYLNLLTFDGNI